jgi:hypothetical protein
MKGDIMKERIILLVLSIACILSSCTTTTGYVPPKVSFDAKFWMISLDGFRIEMSASMAKQVAEERGYKIDSSISFITFDDVINSKQREFKICPDIYLKKGDDGIELSFEYGKLYCITHKQLFSEHQQAEKLLEWYFSRYPELTLSNETEKYKAYKYKPNELASIIVSTEIFGEYAHRVSISVYDRNYAQHKRNQEYYKEIEAIRRRY